jgi:hypothetical protein
MAVTAQGPSAQGLADLGMGSVSGASGPAFPAPDGTELCGGPAERRS